MTPKQIARRIANDLFAHGARRPGDRGRGGSKGRRNAMTYIWESGSDDAKSQVHIARYSPSGILTMLALCGDRQAFDRSINAPWALGRTVCATCRHIAKRDEELPIE